MLRGYIYHFADVMIIFYPTSLERYSRQITSTMKASDGVLGFVLFALSRRQQKQRNEVAQGKASPLRQDVFSSISLSFAITSLHA
jgi:uncharacterized membrane protein